MSDQPPAPDPIGGPSPQDPTVPSASVPDATDPSVGPRPPTPWNQPVPPDAAGPAGPPGPYGAGWADDGGYLRPPSAADQTRLPPYPGQPALGWVATPWGPRWRGPVGKARPAGVTILLSIITCGIWTYAWSYQNHDELQRYRGEGLGGPVALILAIFVNVAIMFTVPMEIEKMYQEEGLPSPVTTTIGLWFLLPIIGNFVWYFKVQEALNDFWVARGAVPA